MENQHRHFGIRQRATADQRPSKKGADGPAPANWPAANESRGHFVGQVIKPWHTITRRRTFHEALRRIGSAQKEPNPLPPPGTHRPPAPPAPPSPDLWRMANSYFGLLRQATHSHTDRARLSNLIRRHGLAVDHRLTKAYA